MFGKSNSESPGAQQDAQQRRPKDVKVPGNTPRDLTKHVNLMYDLLALAFQTDTTRVSTYMLGNAGSNRTYPMVDVNAGWHSLSHHRKEQPKIDQLKRIDKWHVEQFARFLHKLQGIKEGDGTLLDNCMIMYGSGLGDGNAHTHHDLPIVVAGRGGPHHADRAVRGCQGGTAAQRPVPIHARPTGRGSRIDRRQQATPDRNRRLIPADAARVPSG
ncbi:MAG: hypothetical protein CM1200mP2_42300 [Planctomycetaceae bacterium]|nr:MAG: hypothetical protein CM1200mP2_42300 [Planctomycetaceae bacterium]